jgi:hypothetical protein
MPAAIQFYANIVGGENTAIIDHTVGSGLGFYGTNFGISVAVGTKQTSTFVTDANGVNEGAQLNNTMAMNTEVDPPLDPGLVSINGALPPANLDRLPNFLCPLNIRFTNDTPVRVQNCKMRIFDRNNINNPASGVTTYVYEARHPATQQTVSNLSHRGRSSNSWVVFDPVSPMQDMIFTSSPGASGKNTNSSDFNTNLGYITQEGPLHSSSRHDWFVALSSEPESIGSKTQYGLYFTVEYL